MKQCKRCLLEKANTEFRKCSNNKNGLQSYCKTCQLAYNQTEKQKSYAGNYRKNYSPEQINSHRVYARDYSKKYTKQGHSIVVTKKYKIKNPEKVRAHQALNLAIRQGILKRKPCEVCGVSKSDGHHPDYSKPLHVIWLCRIHHSEIHYKNKNGA